jgi:hemerythrin-like domain-containing protein
LTCVKAVGERVCDAALPAPEKFMKRDALTILRNDHANLAAMLQSMRQLVRLGPDNMESGGAERFFDVLRAMLFYIAEFPERLHHPKETDLLFPRVARVAPQVLETIKRLEMDHAESETRVRELMHLLMAWEYLGESRRAAFESEVDTYVQCYLAHMRLEERDILPAAETHLSPAERQALDMAFEFHRDPLDRDGPRDPGYDRLFSRIVLQAPEPMGFAAA